MDPCEEEYSGAMTGTLSALRANYDAASLPALEFDSVVLGALFGAPFAAGVFAEFESLALLVDARSDSPEELAPFESEVSAVAELRPRLSVT